MRRIPPIVATAILSFATWSSASADPASEQKMRSVQYLIGTWKCTDLVGAVQGTYATTFTRTMDVWLRQTSEWSPKDNKAPFRAEFLMGFDGKRWVRFGATNDGMYFGMLGDANAENGFLWRYVFPGSGATAMWLKRSDREFTIDGPQYLEGAQPVSEHHECKKAS